MKRDDKTISREDLTFLFTEVIDKQGDAVLLKTAIPMINKALDFRESFYEGSLKKAVKTLNRLRFGENAINNSEYNLLMGLIAKLRETPEPKNMEEPWPWLPT